MAEKHLFDFIKTIILTFGLFFFFANSSAQRIFIDTSKIAESQVNAEGTVPTGVKATYRFLIDNLIYPDSSLKAKIEGIVRVRFYIDTTGKVTDIKIIEGLSTDINNEVLRVVQLIPDWVKPLIISGRKEKLIINLPITFTLTKSDE